MIFVYHSIQLFKWMKWFYLLFPLHLRFLETHQLLIIHSHACRKFSRTDASIQLFKWKEWFYLLHLILPETHHCTQMFAWNIQEVMLAWTNKCIILVYHNIQLFEQSKRFYPLYLDHCLILPRAHHLLIIGYSGALSGTLKWAEVRSDGNVGREQGVSLDVD